MPVEDAERMNEERGVDGVGASGAKPNKRPLSMIHVGRQVPKSLAAVGWKEVGAMHLGNGVWTLRLERPTSGI